MTGEILAARIRAIQCRTSKRPLVPWVALPQSERDKLAAEALRLNYGGDNAPSKGGFR